MLRLGRCGVTQRTAQPFSVAAMNRSGQTIRPASTTPARVCKGEVA
jgi:hypothetical protein